MVDFSFTYFKSEILGSGVKVVALCCSPFKYRSSS